MASAARGHGTKRNMRTCSAQSDGCGSIVPVACACCSRVLVKEEGVPRVLQGPAKKIKIEFDPEPFIKKEAPELFSPVKGLTQEEHQTESRKRGGEKIVFKEEDVYDGSKSENESILSRPSSASSFTLAKPKANFNNFKQPFKNNHRGGGRYNRPHHYRNAYYKNNSNSNVYYGNNMHFRNNGFNRGFRGFFSNGAPHVMQQIFNNQRPHVASVPLRAPFPVKQPFGPFNAPIKAPTCSPIPGKPSFQYPPSSHNIKRNVMSSVIPDPPRSQSPATSPVGQTWWKALEWPNNSSGSSVANPSNNEKVKLNMSSTSIPVSEIPSPSKTDKAQPKTFIGKDNGLCTQRASDNCAESTVAKSSLNAGRALTTGGGDETDDQALADSIEDDKDWIEELAVQAIIPVKALCSSCLHSSDPKKQDADIANSDIEILFNSCDIQICSEEGSGISRKGPRRPSIFNKTVEVVDVNEFDDDDVEDITSDIHNTSTKKSFAVMRTTGVSDNDVVDIIEDEDKCNEQQGESRKTGEKDSVSVNHGEHILDILDVGEDIVLDEVCSDSAEEGDSFNPSRLRLNEPVEEQQEPLGNAADQDATNRTEEGAESAAEKEYVEPVIDVIDINTEIREVGEEMAMPSEATLAGTSIEHTTELDQSENRAIEAAVVTEEAWDEVFSEMQEIGEEVEELAVVGVHKDTSALKEPKEVAKQCQEDREVCVDSSGVYEKETTRMTGDKKKPLEEAEDVQCVGEDVTALSVPTEVEGSPVVCTLADNFDEVTTGEQEMEEHLADSSSANDRKLIATQALDPNQPRTPRKPKRSSAASTPVRLTRSLRQSSLNHDRNRDTNDPITVDDSMELATSSLASFQKSTSSQSDVHPEKLIATPSRRSSRLTKNDIEIVSVAATVAIVEDEVTQSDQVQIVSSHENSKSVDKIPSSDVLGDKLPPPSKAMARKLPQKTAKYLSCITEASCSTPEISVGVRRVTRRSTAVTQVVRVLKIEQSKRITETGNSSAHISDRTTTPSKKLSEPKSGRVMTRRSMLDGSTAVAPSERAELPDNDRVISKDKDVENELGSEYDLDFEEDLQEFEVDSKEETEVEKTDEDVLLEEDDDVTCLD